MRLYTIEVSIIAYDGHYEKWTERVPAYSVEEAILIAYQYLLPGDSLEAMEVLAA